MGGSYFGGGSSYDRSASYGDCTGEEVCREWLYHIGVPTDKIDDWAKNRCNTTTCLMPYINAFFQPRKEEDRPLVVPKGAVNFAFVGQFAETPRDTIFTTEYSIRTGMEAVYTLLNVDRGVPEVWGSKYDVRELLRAIYYSVDTETWKETHQSSPVWKIRDLGSSSCLHHMQHFQIGRAHV